MPSHPKVLPCTESRSSPSSSVMSPPFSSNQPPSLEAPSLEGSNATSKPPLTEGSKPPPVNLDESVTESKVTDTLNLAVAHAHSLRMRISVASVCFGTVPMLAGNIIYYLLEFFVLSPQKWGSSGYWGSMIAGMGFVMLLGVMPNDDKIIRTLNLIGTVSLIQVGAVCICLALNALIRNPEIPDRSPNTMCSSSTSAACRLFVIKYCLLAVVYILGGLMVCSSLRRIPNAKGFAEDQFVVPARLALEGIWLYTRTTIAIAGGIFFVLAIVMFYDESANAEYVARAKRASPPTHGARIHTVLAYTRCPHTHGAKAVWTALRIYAPYHTHLCYCTCIVPREPSTSRYHIDSHMSRSHARLVHTARYAV